MINQDQIEEIIETYGNGNKTTAINLLIDGRENKPLTLAASTAAVLAQMHEGTARLFTYSLQFRAESHE